MVGLGIYIHIHGPDCICGLATRGRCCEGGRRGGRGFAQSDADGSFTTTSAPSPRGRLRSKVTPPRR